MSDMSDIMLIPETLFDCIRNSLGIKRFKALNKQSIGVKRYQRNKTQEQKDHFKKVMSKAMKKSRKKYLANITPKQKAAFAERMKKGQKRYWENVSKEDKKHHIETMSVGMKKAWAEGRVDLGTKEEIAARLHKIGKVERDLPRINTYSGVITESEMESL